MMVGRVPIYLLDTNIEINHPDDRGLMNKLYAGGPDLRLRQEWILGVGGVRVLRAMGIEPAVWHANEGHAAFMLVERLRECVAQGMSYEDAVHEVRGRSVFTTHTPVPAGHDSFSVEQLEGVRRPGVGGDGHRPGRVLRARRASRLPGQFHMTVDGDAALRPRERRLPAARPGVAEPLARALARPAVGERFRSAT